MSGVSFVLATPRIERRRISRAASVYSCLTRSSWLTRGPSPGSLTRRAGEDAAQPAAEEDARDEERDARTRRRSRASSGCRSPSRRSSPRPARRARDAARRSDRHTDAMTIPTIRASIAWRLGIAAYGFAAKAISAALVVDRANCGERVREAPLGEHPRRRRRHQHVADEARRGSRRSASCGSRRTARGGGSRPRAARGRRRRTARASTCTTSP